LKLGLALEGGAIRTIFSSGVCDGLLDLGIMADHITGVSAGIAYGVSYATRQRGRNLQILEHYVNDDRYMGPSHMLNPLNNCYFNLDFVYNEIPNRLIPYDYAAIRDFPGTVEAVVTDVNTGKPAYLPVPSDDPNNVLLQATCAMPMLFPIIETQGVACLDGGVVDPIPFQRVLDSGCDKVIVIATRERSYEKHQEKALSAAMKMYRKYPAFVEAMKHRAEVYNRQREELFRLEKQGDLFLFCPYSTTGFSRLEKNLEKIRALWQSGVDQALAREGQLRDYLSATD
jgi:predicted patatin/cPLA2 family phospholipase